MKTLELEISDLKTIDELIIFLRTNDISEGDTLRIGTNEEEDTLVISAILYVVILAFQFYFRDVKKKRIEEGGKMLNELFKKGTVEEIEKQIEEEYGVKIEIEHREYDERKEWGMLSVQGLNHAYGDDEPDYSDVPLIETNPDYNPWKQE